MIDGQSRLRGVFIVAWAAIIASCSPASAQPTLDGLWANKARLAYVRDLTFGNLTDVPGPALEASTWYVAKSGVWYAFSRADAPRPKSLCPNDHMKVVARESRDKGVTWSAPAVVATPGMSKVGDGCAILDGSSFFDVSSGSWHLLAQCLDNNLKGGWALCHYSRRSPSPLGPFVADSANPVVRGGQLWSKICGQSRTCPADTVDEGTPDIVAKQNGQFLVTMHGYHGATKSGYRGVVTTPDFRTWAVSGKGLPGAAILGPRDCAAWLRACVGFGEGSSVLADGRIYMVSESMDRNLACTPGQQWVFAIMRSGGPQWALAGTGGWERLPNNALIRRKWRDPKMGCAVTYARWLVDGRDIYLIYEDWEPGWSRVHRRLLKLVPGAGPPIQSL